MVINKDSSEAVKGIAIIIVVLHHYAQNFGYIPDLFRGLGPMACASFFLISGYGLSVNKGSRVKWKNRLLKLYIPFVLSNSMYLVLSLIMDGYELKPTRIITDILGITLINEHCWFLQYLVLFYFLAAIVDVYFEEKRSFVTPIVALIAGGAFSMLGNAPGALSWLAFPLGFILKYIEVKNIRLIESILGLIGLLCFLIYFYLGDMIINTPFLLLNFILMCIATPFGFVFIGDNLRRFAVINRVGAYSIDIYLMHGFIIMLIAKMMRLNTYSIIIYLLLIAIIAFLFNGFQNKVLNLMKSKE